jgi:hypothetical protein
MAPATPVSRFRLLHCSCARHEVTSTLASWHATPHTAIRATGGWGFRKLRPAPSTSSDWSAWARGRLGFRAGSREASALRQSPAAGRRTMGRVETVAPQGTPYALARRMRPRQGLGGPSSDDVHPNLRITPIAGGRARRLLLERGRAGFWIWPLPTCCCACARLRRQVAIAMPLLGVRGVQLLPAATLWALDRPWLHRWRSRSWC